MAALPDHLFPFVVCLSPTLFVFVAFHFISCSLIYSIVAYPISRKVLNCSFHSPILLQYYPSAYWTGDSIHFFLFEALQPFFHCPSLLSRECLLPNFGLENGEEDPVERTLQNRACWRGWEEGRSEWARSDCSTWYWRSSSYWVVSGCELASLNSSKTINLL